MQEAWGQTKRELRSEYDQGCRQQIPQEKAVDT